MLTRKVDLEDASPAGFTYTWVKKIGEKLDKLYVITWQKSDRGNLPKNIEIISLPNSKFLKVFILQFKLLGILPKIDGIFCHQNPEYTILAAPLAKIFRKKIKGLAIKSSPFYYFIFIPVVSFLLIQFYARKVQYP